MDGGRGGLLLLLLLSLSVRTHKYTFYFALAIIPKEVFICIYIHICMITFGFFFLLPLLCYSKDSGFTSQLTTTYYSGVEFLMNIWNVKDSDQVLQHKFIFLLHSIFLDTKISYKCLCASTCITIQVGLAVFSLSRR